MNSQYMPMHHPEKFNVCMYVCIYFAIIKASNTKIYNIY